MAKAGVVDAGVRQDGRNGARDLLRRLHGAPALSDLSVNPLLLTMIATVHRYRSSLPGRVELHGEICEVSLGKRQQSKGLELDLTPAQTAGPGASGLGDDGGAQAGDCDRRCLRGDQGCDAWAFCDWLTQREGGQWRFRMPTAEERATASLAADSADISPCAATSGHGSRPSTWPARLEDRLEANTRESAGVPAVNLLPPPFARAGAVALALAFPFDRDRYVAFVGIDLDKLGPDHGLMRGRDRMFGLRDALRSIAIDLAQASVDGADLPFEAVELEEPTASTPSTDRHV